jgi:hypothetical protein
MEVETYRCPACHALVVDRRFATCTTCNAELPKEWILSPEQVLKLEEFDRHARAEHATAMNELDPDNDPTTRDTRLES